MITVAQLAQLPAIAHGFFTRQGGVSQGLFASLNCGLGSGDDRAHVVENRARAARRFGLDADRLVTLYQIHSPDVITVAEPWTIGHSPRADAMVSDRPGIMLGVLAADCAPVLLADAEAKVIGAAHAGWRGALAGVTDATVAAMEELGARRGRIVAAIGPCIAQASYEVGAEFRQQFVDAAPGNDAHFAPGVREGKFQFDLPGYLLGRLRGLGVAASWSGHDTRTNEAAFFSYRRASLRGEKDYGRGLSAIALQG